MSFKPDTRSTPSTSAPAATIPQPAAKPYSGQRDARLLLAAFIRILVYSAAAVGFFVAIVFPIIHAFGVASSFEPPGWLAVILLICICIYGYFDIRDTFTQNSKPNINDPKPPGNA